MDKRTLPSVKALNALAAEVNADAEAAENDPNYDFDPETYTMPSSMMLGTQVDADQLPPAPKQD